MATPEVAERTLDTAPASEPERAAEPKAPPLMVSQSNHERGNASDGPSSNDHPALARIWQTLRTVEDPEIPVSVVDMGMVVAVAYDAPTRTARLQITYTAMGCPAMTMIQDDIRDALLKDPEVDAVDIEVVWDPVWSRKRLSDSAKARMRELGIAA